MKKVIHLDVLIESYNRLRNVWLVADEVGLCGQSVHERLTKHGFINKINVFTDEDKRHLINNYTKRLLLGQLNDLALEMGRTKQFICRKAKELGITNISRKKSDILGFEPIIKKGHWDNKEHPRGMLGKKHTEETIANLSVINKRTQDNISLDKGKRSSISKQIISTKYKNGNLINPRQKQTWKAGWRKIGCQELYFRSRWEANYARYLDYLKFNGSILDWVHEAEIFMFDSYEKGMTSYLPDFKVTTILNSLEYHEVKGWMDDRSCRKIKLMNEQHPNIKLVILDSKWYNSNKRNLSKIVNGWEND